LQLRVLASAGGGEDLTGVLEGFDPLLLLVLSLAGTFAFGLSGGLAAVRARLDAFGVVALAVVVGLAGGITRDLLIGTPPQAFRDWRYLAVAGSAGVLTFVAHAALSRLARPILILDAGGLALFCVTGAGTALDNRVAPLGAVVLGAITGVGGGVLRDVLLREIPVVLRTGLYAVPAVVGAAIVVVASESGTHNIAVPIIGAAVCFAIRVAGVYFDWNVPTPWSTEPTGADERRHQQR
jgi:uncharacterized membrane protein YeiH